MMLTTERAREIGRKGSRKSTGWRLATPARCLCGGNARVAHGGWVCTTCWRGFPWTEWMVSSDQRRIVRRPEWSRAVREAHH